MSAIAMSVDLILMARFKKMKKEVIFRNRNFRDLVVEFVYL